MDLEILPYSPYDSKSYSSCTEYSAMTLYHPRSCGITFIGPTLDDYVEMEHASKKLFHSDTGDQDSWVSDDEHEELVHEDDIGEWDTDDEVEEAHINDDIIRQLEGDW